MAQIGDKFVQPGQAFATEIAGQIEQLRHIGDLLLALRLSDEYGVIAGLTDSPFQQLSRLQAIPEVQ